MEGAGRGSAGGGKGKEQLQMLLRGGELPAPLSPRQEEGQLSLSLTTTSLVPQPPQVTCNSENPLVVTHEDKPSSK